MAKVLSVLILVLLVAASVVSVVVEAGNRHHVRSYGEGSLKSTQCKGECRRRCSQTQYMKPCNKYCNKCCATCLCVPPGFYDHREVCPCYNNWNTQEGTHKCP